MSQAGSKLISITPIPYVRKLRSFTSPADDWGYYEGLPTPPLSPLMPYNTVPWWSRKWQYDKMVAPQYSLGYNRGINSTDISTVGKKWVSKTIINSPTLIKDYHIISIRRQVEQLFSPMFSATILAKVKDTMHHEPCYFINHNRFQKSWWIGDGTGGEILSPGHYHWFREGGPPTGSLTINTQLTIESSQLKDRKGAIGGLKVGDDFRSSYGNYYIVAIEHTLIVTEFWRKMALESWSSISADHHSIAPTFLQILWGPWASILNPSRLPTGEAKAFAIDQGMMWQPLKGGDFNEDTIVEQSDNYWFPKQIKVGGRYAYVGPGYTACSRPMLEGPLTRESGGGSTEIAAITSLDEVGFAGFRNVAGFNCGITTKNVTPLPPADTPLFPEKIVRNGLVVFDAAKPWEHGGVTAPMKNGRWDVTYTVKSNQTTITPSETRLDMDGYYYVAHCIGCKIIPVVYVTIQDFNKKRYRVPVTECEVYFQ